jgi:hypothetical protein
MRSFGDHFVRAELAPIHATVTMSPSRAVHASIHLSCRHGALMRQSVANTSLSRNYLPLLVMLPHMLAGTLQAAVSAS